MTTDVEGVLTTVRERVTPSPEEQEALREAASELIDQAERALDDLSVEGEAFLVGSAARGTWIAGEQDIDLFVRFPRVLDREELEELGLEVGHAVLPDGREEWAEHPYVTGEYQGFDVDLVPCYDVDSAQDIESAVDRTPFHTAYLTERLTDDVALEVRLFKQFLQGVGIYGSNLKTQGFSGYLTELLVLEYGSAKEVVQAATDWHPPVVIDPEGHGNRSFDDPLVVIDPTDPSRNVAAVLSAENLARFQHHARQFFTDPSLDVFFPNESDSLTRAAVEERIRSRGTTPIALVFERPNRVDDELYPQLRKSLTGIRDALERRGFDVLRSASFARDRAVLLHELAVAERPRVERHMGPPVHVREHAEDFYTTYADSSAFGPFIEEDRYVVERERSFVRASEFLASDALYDVRLGPAIEERLRQEHSLLVGEEVATLASTFGKELADYFNPSP